jgi:flagellar basal body P-ring formation protein FlgA
MILLPTLLLAGVTITLPEEAFVLGSEISLGEIATIEGAKPAQLERLEAFQLGYAPSPGYSRALQDWKIQGQLMKAFSDIEFEVTGSNVCRIRPTVATVKGVELQDAAKKVLENMLDGEDMTLRLVHNLDDEIVPQGLSGRRIVIEPSTTTISSSTTATGTWSVPIQILVDGLPYRTVWATYDVTLYRDMPVLRRDIQKGEPILAADMVIRRSPLTAPSNEKPMQVSELHGATANRQLSMNRPVGRRDVTRAKAIKKGETVSLVVKNGTILVKTYGTALTDAYIGDTTKVQISGTTKELAVTVVAMGSVEFEIN